MRRCALVPVPVQGGSTLIHLSKLCVGVRDVAHLAALHSTGGDPPFHRTRHMPRRAAELVAGGSLYWVIAGQMTVRQRVTAVEPDNWPDGSACCALRLDPVLVLVTPRPVRAFQGWRYLEPAGAPDDLVDGVDALGLPPGLRQELTALGLL